MEESDIINCLFCGFESKKIKREVEESESAVDLFSSQDQDSPEEVIKSWSTILNLSCHSSKKLCDLFNNCNLKDLTCFNCQNAKTAGENILKEIKKLENELEELKTKFKKTIQEYSFSYNYYQNKGSDTNSDKIAGEKARKIILEDSGFYPKANNDNEEDDDDDSTDYDFPEEESFTGENEEGEPPPAPRPIPFKKVKEEPEEYTIIETKKKKYQICLPGKVNLRRCFCKICKKIFLHPRKFIQHSFKEHGEKYYQCNTCFEFFGTDHRVLGHFNRVHGDIISEKSEDSDSNAADEINEEKETADAGNAGIKEEEPEEPRNPSTYVIEEDDKNKKPENEYNFYKEEEQITDPNYMQRRSKRLSKNPFCIRKVLESPLELEKVQELNVEKINLEFENYLIRFPEAENINWRKCNCGRSFTSPELFADHSFKWHEKLYLQCKICKEFLGSKNSFQRHFDKSHTEQMKCEKCDKEIPKIHLDKHLKRCHSNEPKKKKYEKFTGEGHRRRTKRYKSSILNLQKIKKIRIENENSKETVPETKIPESPILENSPVIDRQIETNSPKTAPENTVKLPKKRNMSVKYNLKFPNNIDWKNCFCGRTFTSPKEFADHAYKIHGEKYFKCKKCNKFYGTPNYVYQHYEKIHFEKKDFKCEQCDYVSHNKFLLRSHFKNKHLERQEIICEICGSKYKSKNTYRIHFLKEHQEKPFKCTHDKCEKSFSRERLLKKHILWHLPMELRPFKCSYPSCSSAFNSKEKLRDHLTLHGEERNFMCEICARTFTCHKNLVSHKYVMHYYYPKEKNKSV